MFISYYAIIYFFVKNFLFECLYFSAYDIRMYLFVFWLRNRPSIKYARNEVNGGEEGFMCTGFMCKYALHYLFSCFCLMVSCFICRNLTLPSFKNSKKVCLSEMVIFSSKINFCCDEISFFFTLNCFSEPKLAKTVLILIKQNLRYTLKFSVTPYFEKILCSVAQRFIWEVILYRYLQTLFYTIVIEP